MADISLRCLGKMEQEDGQTFYGIVAKVADALGYEFDLVLKSDSASAKPIMH